MPQNKINDHLPNSKSHKVYSFLSRACKSAISIFKITRELIKMQMTC